MPRRALMTEAQRDGLLAVPTDEATLARHWMLGDEDLAIIARRRRPHNRLGFAVQLCALRYPGRLLRPGELIPDEALRFVAAQLAVLILPRFRGSPAVCVERSRRRSFDGLIHGKDDFAIILAGLRRRPSPSPLRSSHHPCPCSSESSALS